MQRRKVVYTSLLLFFLATAHTLFASTPPSRLEGLQQSVLALDSAWTRAINDFQHKQSTGSLAESEQKDYAKFIAYLSSRIDHYCHLLRTEGGDQAVINLPCAENAEPSSSLEQPTAKTQDEQVAALDKSLTEALGEFDEQLLKEEQRIASRTPSERESGRGYGGGGGTGSSGQKGGTGQAGTTGSTQGRESSQNGSGSSQSGQESSQSGSGSPQSGQGSGASSSGAGAGTGSQEQQDDPRSGSQEIESGYDDIVARQLREAAEKETDPELKKKLWEEYRKYKEGIN